MRIYGLPLSVLATTLFLSGCGIGPSAVTTQTGPALRGLVHGGQQPVTGAHVYLLAASNAGYGSAATSLLTSGTAGTDSIGSYVLTDNSGNFSITSDYSCTSGQQVYVLATQGNPGLPNNQTNPNLALMAVLGACPLGGTFATQDSFITVNEVTTIAGVYALSGFMTDLSHVASGTSAQSQLGMTNAFANAANLAAVATGSANATSGMITVPQDKINLLADIIAACVNTNGASSSACTTLFGNAVNGATQPTDTVTAALNIAHHPGANITNLYGLQTAGSPFPTAITSQPNDFTLSMQVSGGGLFQPIAIAIDASGNVWLANENNTLSKVSPLGVPISPATGYQNVIGQAPTQMSFDLNGYLWVPNFSSSYNSVSKISPSGTAVFGSPFTPGGISSPSAAAVDSIGNLWIANYSGGHVSELNTSTNASESSTGYAEPVSNPLSIAVDTTGNVWISGQQGTTISRISNSGATSPGSPYTVAGGPGPIAFDAAGNAWIAGTGSPGELTELSSSGNAVSGSPFSGGGLCADCAKSIAVDGGGNIWISIGAFGSPYTIGVSEFSNAGVPQSPSTAFTSPYLSYPFGIAVDPSGNVWVADNGTGNATLVEYVGAAVPTVTPLSVALQNNTVGTRP